MTDLDDKDRFVMGLGRYFRLRGLLALAFLFWSLTNYAFAEKIVIPKGPGLNCQRIVSVSPALSDMMMDLKLDSNIVGSTRYGRLPESSTREVVGGYFDLNFEKVVSLKPDIVFLEGNMNNPITERLDALGIKNRAYSLDTLDEMEAAKQEIANYCEGEVTIGVGTLKEQIDSLLQKAKAQAKTKGKRNDKTDTKPRVLILYNYGSSAEKILPKLAAGRSFHGELLEALEMENVYIGSLNAPELGRESIGLLNPEWIFILNGEMDDLKAPRDLLRVEHIAPKWDFLMNVDALKNQRVYELYGFYTQIPSVSAMRNLAKVMTELVYSSDKPE